MLELALVAWLHVLGPGIGLACTPNKADKKWMSCVLVYAVGKCRCQLQYLMLVATVP